MPVALTGLSKKQVLWASAWIVAALALGYYLTDCGACLKKQDYEFSERLKAQLDGPGDSVRVADVHPDGWTKVCTVGMGYDASLKHFAASALNVPEKELSVRTETLPFISDRYDDSAVIFFYEPAEIEIYRMLPSDLVYWSRRDGDACLERDDAHFRVKTDRSRFSTETINAAHTSDSYIELQLITTKEIENGA